jgi:hypothetical protein
MANGPKPVDLGFAEFAAQIVAELHEGLLVAQNEQESRRAKLAELSSLPLDEFARRFVTNDQVEAELVRFFPARRGKTHRIRVGGSYMAKTAKHAESPPIQSKLGIQLTPQDLRVRAGRTQLTAKGVKGIREALRMRLAEPRFKTLRQSATQGIPRLVLDCGRVNVKLMFRLEELEKVGVRKAKGSAIVPLNTLVNILKAESPLPRYQLVVRQVNEQTTPVSPTESSGIGELDLTLKTI